MVAGDKTALFSKWSGGATSVARSVVDYPKKSMHFVHSEDEKNHNVEPKSQMNSEAPPEGLNSSRHIHPCVCDLTDQQRKRIKEHQEQKAFQRKKFEQRVREIEEKLAKLEEERLERERELQEHEDLFGDQYEMIGKRKKRKKRSARRASMVSLGVKQVINWKKEPKIKVRYNYTYKLRSGNPTYCNYRKYKPISVKAIHFKKMPAIPVRETKANSLRAKVNGLKYEDLLSKEDKRPLFLSAFWY